MADTGFVIVGTGFNRDRDGNAVWQNPTRVTADDGSEASVGGGQLSDWLGGDNLGLTDSEVPSGATIDGIEVRIQLFEVTAVFGRPWGPVKLQLSDDSVGTNDNSPGGNIPTADGTNTDLGGASDLWGDSWTDTDVKNANFGVLISVNNGIALAECDALWVKVYYTEGGGPSSIAIPRRRLEQD